MKVLTFEEIDSTNSYAKSHIKDLEDRSVVHALRQTSGRGRLNRRWVDLGEGNLFFSIVLRPSEDFRPVYSNLTQYASLVLVKILEKYGVSPKIKWPNDVMIDGERKISGILSETVMQSGKLEGIVIGIGVNLNAKIDDVKNVPDRVVTALNLEIGKKVDMNSFLSDFLDLFFENYDEFLIKGFDFIKDEYLKYNCFIGKFLNVQVLNSVKSGYADKVNDDGELVLKTKDLKEVTLTIGDIL